MQRYIAQLHAFGGDLFHQFPGKMQAGGGGRGAADFPGIDGLVPLAVLQLLLDVGRQRHFTQPLQHLQEDALIIKADDAVAALRHALHGGLQFSIAEKDLRAGPGLPARAAEAFPAALPQVPQQHQLHAAAGGPGADQPGRQHPGIVKDHAVPFPQIVQQIIKMPVLQFPCGLIQMQQAGAIPPLQRGLGDQFFRQVKIKVGFSQRNSPFPL